MNPFLLSNGGAPLATPEIISAADFEFNAVDGKAIYVGDGPVVVYLFARMAMAEVDPPTNVYQMAFYINNVIYPNSDARVSIRVEDTTHSSGGLVMTMEICY